MLTTQKIIYLRPMLVVDESVLGFLRYESPFFITKREIIHTVKQNNYMRLELIATVAGKASNQ